MAGTYLNVKIFLWCDAFNLICVAFINAVRVFAAFILFIIYVIY